MKIHCLSGKCLVYLTLISSIIFATCIVSSVAAPGSAADADYPLFFIIDYTPGVPGGDVSFIFTDHTSLLATGSWIQLTGGIQHIIPVTSFTLNYPPDSTSTVNGNDVTVDSFVSTDTFDYPLTTHPTYLPGQTVTATYYGHTNLAGDSDLEWRLIKGSESQLDAAYSSAFDGDASDFVTLLSNGNTEWFEAESSLDGTGDAATTFTAPAAGIYYLFLVAETSSPYKIVVYGCTQVEVLDYTITSTVPSTVTRGNFLNIPIQISNPPGSTNGFTYGAAIISNSGYDFDIAISSDSTITSTSVEINGEVIIQGTGSIGAASLAFPGIPSQSSFDSIEITQKLTNIISSGNIALGFSTQTLQTSSTVSINTGGLNIGNYKALIGVWEDDMLAGFTTGTVYVRASSGRGGGGGGTYTPPLPDPDVVENLDPEDAFDLLKNYPIEDIASVLDEIDPSHAAKILELFDEDVMYDILSEMSETVIPQILNTMDPMEIATILNILQFDKQTMITGMSPETAGQVLNHFDAEIAATILVGLSPENAEIIEQMAQDDLVNAALLIETAVYQILDELDTATQAALLALLADTLETLSVETIVNLFIEIAGLPDTPSTVALLMENMDTTIISLMIENWIKQETLEPLANVLTYTSQPLLDQVYNDLGNQGRIDIYPYLITQTIAKLPVLSTFTVTDLVINPNEVYIGDTVEITYNVENTGEHSDDYEIDVKVGGVSETISTGILAPGATAELSLLVERDTVGRYQVDVAGLRYFFDVISSIVIAPATFVIEEIGIIPDQVEQGETVFVYVTVFNEGDESGSTTIDLLLDSETIETMDIFVTSQSRDTFLFEVDMDVEVGDHTFSVNGFTNNIAVSQPSIKMPWATIFILAVILTTATLYVIISRSRKGELTSFSEPKGTSLVWLRWLTK